MISKLEQTIASVGTLLFPPASGAAAADAAKGGAPAMPAPRADITRAEARAVAALQQQTDACNDAIDGLTDKVLKNQPDLGTMVKGWSDKIDDGFKQHMYGYDAVQGGIDTINSNLGDLQKNLIDAAQANLKTLNGCRVVEDVEEFAVHLPIVLPPSVVQQMANTGNCHIRRYLRVSVMSSSGTARGLRIDR